LDGDEGTFLWCDSRGNVSGRCSSTGPNQFLVQADGGVGIGTNNPAGQLSLGDYQGGNGTSAVESFDKQLVLGGPFNLGFNTGDSVKLLISDYDNDGVSNIYPIYVEDENNRVDFYVRTKAGARTAFFGGRVGLGTKDPRARFHVTNESVVPASSALSGDDAVISANDAYLGLYSNTGGNFGSAITFKEINSETFSLENTWGIIRQTSSRGAALLFTYGTAAGPAGNAVRLHLATNGRVGIGRTPTANTLEVQGSASKLQAGSWLSNSDRRIKKHIETIHEALDTLDRVRLVTFEYTDDYRAAHPPLDQRRYMNIIAQEFQEVFPDYVKGSGERLPNGEEILQVDPYPLTIYAAAAVQELHKAVKKQRAQITALERENESIRARLDAIEGRKPAHNRLDVSRAALYPLLALLGVFGCINLTRSRKEGVR